MAETEIRLNKLCDVRKWPITRSRHSIHSDDIYLPSLIDPIFEQINNHLPFLTCVCVCVHVKKEIFLF